MIMCTYKRICITNRLLVSADGAPFDALLSQLKHVFEDESRMHPDCIILREKDLSQEQYQVLAGSVIALCKQYDVRCILHTFVDVAKMLGHNYIHVPFAKLQEMSEEEKACFDEIGVSTHTVLEAQIAEKRGAAYVTTSPIFETTCKPGVKAKGLDFLREVSYSVQIPVYALGGIHEEDIELCVLNGAAGVCMMSEYMRS